MPPTLMLSERVCIAWCSKPEQNRQMHRVANVASFLSLGRVHLTSWLLGEEYFAAPSRRRVKLRFDVRIVSANRSI